MTQVVTLQARKTKLPEVVTLQARKTKLPEIVTMNVLMCLFVVFVHVSSAQVTAFTQGVRLWGVVFVPWRLVTINVRGFLFLSALKLFHNRKTDFDYKKFYWTRLTKIILPYLLWTMVYYLYFIQRGYSPFSMGDLLHYILLGDLVGPFYFIVVLVQFYALVPLWFYLFQKVHPVLMLTVTSVLTLFFSLHLPDIVSLVAPGSTFIYNDRVFTTYLLFWVVGCYAGAHYDDFKKIILSNKAFITASFVCLLILDGFLSYLSFSGIRPISWLETIHYLYCLSAILFLYMVFSGHDLTRVIQNGFIRLLDRSTYHIYLIHSLIIFIADDYMTCLGITRLSVTYVIRIVTVYTVAVGLCLAWSWLKQRWKRPDKLST